MSIKIKGLLLFFILLLVVSVSAQNKNKDILAAVQDKYKSINNLSAGLKQSLNEQNSFNGKIYYAKGNKLKLELKNSTIISNGIVLWNYNKSQKKVVINNFSGSDPSFFEIDNFLYGYPSKSIVTFENENNNNVIVLVPRKENKLNFKKAKIMLNQEFLIIQLSIENLSGTVTTFQFSNYKLNQNLPESVFSFSPPEGANIIDLRK